MTSVPKTVFRRDYTPPSWLVDTIDLVVDLDETQTRVSARSTVRRNPDAADRSVPLILDGEALTLEAVAVDGDDRAPDSYQVTDKALILNDVPDGAVVDIVTRIDPHANTALSGLYLSNGVFCTQCEAEGFRRITYFPDRPDVMARFTATVVGDRDRCPVLLSNGNPVDAGTGAPGRHWAKWSDPWPKPSYLFALVAGDLTAVRDHFVTRSGRSVALAIWVRHGEADQCGHAMESLKAAMRWDEEVYGLEYDLDVFNIVAISDFNMGAMENKGLNIFNSAVLLAKPETATDGDYRRIESVVAHEYFHNWTGNRITCRDWFQLSLKEGLTVFRDQEFSADHGNRAVRRIQDVRRLRAAQFPEDAGPMAHPVRPESYMEINNFYTPTVYEKGAEVVRMMHTVLGPERFRAGMDLYISRHDQQAVTCNDFVAALADATGVDLGSFRVWYSQAGTPELTISDSYDADRQRYTLEVRQETRPTPGQSRKRPVPIPLAIGLVGPDGQDLTARLAGEDQATAGTRTVVVDAAAQTIAFDAVRVRPVPSLLRGFSAPVKLSRPALDRLKFLFARDGDPFARWEAGQQLATWLLLDMVGVIRQGGQPSLDADFVAAFGATLADDRLEAALIAEALTLPSIDYLADQMDEIDTDAAHQAREIARRTLAAAHRNALMAAYAGNRIDGPYTAAPADMGRRALRNLCLDILSADATDDDAWRLVLEQYRQADNMTDRLAALAIIGHSSAAERQACFDDFYETWRDHALVVDKWFSLQATSRRADTIDRILALREHPDFDRTNPNRVRSLFGAFAMANPLCFHGRDGRGYDLLADEVIAVDSINPQIAARLLVPLGRWRRHDAGRQSLMRTALERVLEAPDVSGDVYEIATKGLA